MATHEDAAPIDVAWYLPEFWTREAELRQKARIPESITFKTKPEPALDMIERGRRAHRGRVARRGAPEEAAPAGGVTFTFDTGMLIALERRKARAWEAFRAIVRRGYVPVVPAIVYVEWRRGRSDEREALVDALLVEELRPILCGAAGEALAAVRGATLADAIVMASAALRGGGVVYTSAPDDLGRLARHFPTVRIVEV